MLAQNRQDDRDRVSAEQDRRRAAKNHAEIEYLTREIASLRLSMSEVATRDFVRGELRDLLDELRAEEYQKARRDLEENKHHPEQGKHTRGDDNSSSTSNF